MAQQVPKRLYLLDGMALVYRAHFALIRSPRYTTGGLCTSAVYGMANMVLDVLKREQPSHMAVAFDTSDPTHRHEAFPEYKATREELPEDIAAQLPYVDRLFNALKIRTIRIPGYEADDILGTLAHRAEQEGFQTWLVTPDKDFQQLVTENIRVYKPGRQGSQFEILGVAEVLDKWKVERVHQVLDILGLMGDASDNIPGVPGIGEKTAQKLIAQFGSIENLLASADQLKGKQKERVEAHGELALQSKRLVTISLDVPVDIPLGALLCQQFDKKALRRLFEDLEFDTLGRRTFGSSFTSAPARAAARGVKRQAQIQKQLFAEPVSEKNIREVEHDYRIVATASERGQLVQRLQAQAAFCLDAKATGHAPRESLPLGIAFCFKPQAARYVELPEDPVEARQVVEQFRPVLENESIAKIGHDLKQDVSALRWHGIEVRGPLMDTMLAHSMKEPEMRHGLDFLAQLYLGYQPIPASQLMGRPGEPQRDLRDVPREGRADYACEQADIALQVWQVIQPDLEKCGVSQVCHAIECPLIPVLVDMEYEGIRLDVDALRAYAQQLEKEIAGLRDAIHQAAGRHFNIDSPKQLGLVLYEELQLVENPKKTATGQYSTRETELVRLAGTHQIVRDVLDYRNAVKLKSVYVDQLPDYVNPRTGRVHTHYLQTWTATGRMQSNDPNLQTIPVRKERGREIRAAFIPRSDDYLILSADYSQIELRIMAELSGDVAMRESFLSGTDIHIVTAANVYKVAREDVTREMRDKAKMVNFGIIYGISSFGLQQRLNIPRQEANDLINNYFEQYPGVRAYIDATIAFAREHGYVKTRSGRRRYIRDIESRNNSLRNAAERLAMNSPIQGTAADLLKLAMIKVHRALRQGNYRTRMLLTVHDEIVFDLYKDERPTVVPLIEQCMKTALPMKVPIVVEMGVGQNWLEAHR